MTEQSDPSVPSAAPEAIEASEAPDRRPSRRRWYALAAGVAVAALGAWLAFGYFGVQTAFLDDEVDEAGPVFDSGAAAEPAPSDPDTTDATDPVDAGAGEGATPAATTPTTAAPVIERVVEGSFIDRSHPAEGQAVVLSDGTAQRFLRLEGFATDNGPDLNVYLSTAPPDAPEAAFDDDFVDLGDLQGNVGDQNYEVPAGVDLDRYPTVVIWCVRFGVAFGTAGLA